VTRRARFDVVIVGSGINSLVCASLLTQRGRRVCVLERESVVGGCIRSASLTAPGFVHDTLSTLYPRFITAPHFPLLGPDLAAQGVTFLNTDIPTGVVMLDGRSLVFTRDRDRNAMAFDSFAKGDGAAYRRAMAEIEASAPITRALLGGDLRSWRTFQALAKGTWLHGFGGMARYFGDSLESCGAWLRGEFRSEVSRALFAPWLLHAGSSPEAALSGLLGKLILNTLERAGSPVVQGGSARLVEGFTRLIERGGGVVESHHDVVRVAVARGAAAGVIVSGGYTIHANTAVVANVTPTQLYGRLLADEAVPESIREEAKRYRYGLGQMQIHLALDELPQWPDPVLSRVGMLHVTAGLDTVSQAVSEAERGLLPAQATISVAQPASMDPTRVPRGKWILWIQLQELPRDGMLRGDALGVLAVPSDGRWTEVLREAYADRIIERLCALISNLRRAIVGRHVISPGDLAALNMNLVGGDAYSGACSLDQLALWRPSRSGGGHRTPIRRLLHIGASTHPGPSVAGISGLIAARKITRL
jgi:phytoene dehydrogenase-like protein